MPALPLLTSEPMDVEHEYRSDFATSRFPQAIRFVVVNNRVPCADHTAQCAVALLRKATFVIHRRD